MFWGGGILVYRTYALYQEEKEYNVIKGIVPDFGYDIKLAINIDGEDADSVPERGDGLYKTNVTCNNKVIGKWDYNAWNLRIDNLKKDTKCTIEFESNGITKEQYDEYISEGVSLRRNTYRGKDITSYYEDKSLYEMISSGRFDDIYVGDYFTTTKPDSNGENHTVTWLIADLNNYLHSGYNDLTTNHATIIPAQPFYNAQMNTETTTGVVDEKLTLQTKDNQTRTNVGAYVGSKMKQEILPDDILKNYIEPVFGENIITYTNLLADQYDGNRSNQYGTTNGGASSGWAWYDSQLDLMSEVNVYGSTVWSSSGYDIGIDNRQYAIFKLKPEFINSYGTTRFHYWLKAVALSTGFAGVGDGGVADAYAASYSHGVRPRFLID